MVGALLGQRYELIELVGKGGMADVYKAKCTLLNRYVAIKVLRDEFKNDEEFLKRFNVESQAAAGLSHNNIVSVYDVGTQGEIHYIVMEYVEGITLKEYLKKFGPLSWEKAVHFATQIASALQHAHRKGIVHRDIKPQNILVTKDEVLKVTDFGIARAVSSVTMKVDDNSMGTVHYCSPEQSRGGYTDAKSDIYSLGVVLYEMVTGRLPFEGDSSVTVALKHIQEEAIPPSQFVAELPEGVEEIIMRAMKKEQAERYATASEMYIELSMIKQGNGYTVPAPAESVPGETKVFSAKEVQEVKQELERVDKKKERTKQKGKTTQADKVAIWAAIGSAFLIVTILTLLALGFIGLLPGQGGGQEIEVPNLVGYQFETAVREYDELNIVEDSRVTSDKPAGVIIKQKTDPGKMVKKSWEIRVIVSAGGEKKIVPNIVGMDIEEAKIKLDDEGFTYEIVEQQSDKTLNTVIAVSPSVKSEVTDAHVTITVSSKDEGSVPNVVGEKKKDAKEMIEERGYKVEIKEQDSYEPKDTVVKYAWSGDTVTLYVSNGKKEKPVVNTPDPDDEEEEPATTTPSTGNGNSGSTTTTPSGGTTTPPTTGGGNDEDPGWY